MAKGKTQKKLAPRVGDGGPRKNKADAVADFKERFERSSAIVLTEYRGLKVNQIGTLREKLRDAGADYKVYKNTMATIAVRDLGVGELEAMLQGPTAAVFAIDDVVATAKALAEFAKENELLVIKGGLFDGKPLTAAAVMDLARLESREVMLAKIAGMFLQPIQKTANLFASPLTKVGALFAQLRDKLPQGDAPAPVAEAAVDATPEAPADEAPTEAVSEETPVADGDGSQAQDEGK